MLQDERDNGSPVLRICVSKFLLVCVVSFQRPHGHDVGPHNHKQPRYMNNA